MPRNSAPDGKDLIAKYCDFWFAEYRPAYRNFEANIERIAADICDMNLRAAKLGRRLRYAINPQVIICETQEAAEALADAEERTAHNRDRMVNALGAGLVGTPEVLAERLRRYREIGIGCVMTRFSPMLPGIELFGSKVIPLLRSEEPRHA